jgi:hypothetical protein
LGPAKINASHWELFVFVVIRAILQIVLAVAGQRNVIQAEIGIIQLALNMQGHKAELAHVWVVRVLIHVK